MSKEYKILIKEPDVYVSLSFDEIKELSQRLIDGIDYIGSLKTETKTTTKRYIFDVEVSCKETARLTGIHGFSTVAYNSVLDLDVGRKFYGIVTEICDCTNDSPLETCSRLIDRIFEVTKNKTNSNLLNKESFYISSIQPFDIENTIVAYTDGSSHSKSGLPYGSCGIILNTQSQESETSMYEPFTNTHYERDGISIYTDGGPSGSNDISELSAIRDVLNNINTTKGNLVIIADSDVCLKRIRDYIHKWTRVGNDWYKKPNKKDPASNPELISEIVDKIAELSNNGLDIYYKWTKSHVPKNDPTYVANEFNELCDLKANEMKEANKRLLEAK